MIDVSKKAGEWYWAASEWYWGADCPQCGERTPILHDRSMSALLVDVRVTEATCCNGHSFMVSARNISRPPH